MGEKKLISLGYPTTSVIGILNKVLTLANVPIVREDCLCNKKCVLLEDTLDPWQFSCGLMRMRMNVLHVNVYKLLQVCVPTPEKWTEFGWDSKTVEEIMDELSKEDIPNKSAFD